MLAQPQVEAHKKKDKSFSRHDDGESSAASNYTDQGNIPIGKPHKKKKVRL